MSLLRKRVRIEQTVRQVDQLDHEIEEWFVRRRDKDPDDQYRTQLGCLETLLSQTLEMVRAAVDAVPVSGSLTEVYAQTRALEQRLLLVRRLWRFYREKFDQRDDSRFREVLAAADEIAWSCYKPPFQNAPDSDLLALPTVPLPYVEPKYSPQVISRMDLPSDLQTDFFREVLYNLPFGVVSLPPSCVDNPWWLIFLGHEVGHHVQFDLLPQKKLLTQFRELLEKTVGADPKADDKAVKRWAGWNLEIFADFYSVLCMGPWAGAALTELALTTDAAMLRHKTRYPAPVVRLKLVERMVRQLDVWRDDASGGFDSAELADPPKMIADDLELSRKVSAALAEEPIEALGEMPSFVGWQAMDFADGGSVAEWTSGFLGESALYAEKTLSAARLAVCGALAAWRQIARIEDDVEREEERQALASQVLEIIPK